MLDNVNYYQLGYQDSLRNTCRNLSWFPSVALSEYSRGWIEAMVKRKDKLEVRHEKQAFTQEK